MKKAGEELKELYEKRFEGECLQREKVWKELCGSFFQDFIRVGDVVVDIGAGYCEFINNINCEKKYAIDLNEDTPDFAGPDVRVLVAPSTDLSLFFKDSTVDVVFMSNFLEHLKSKDEVLQTLREAFRVLKPNGRIMILQPNIRYAYKEYWDFFDHYTPLSDRSLVEALQVAGFGVEKVLPRFLPYTTKSRVPKSAFLIRAYLKLPLAWRMLGKQMFVVARKKRKEEV